ncbi:MAG TPA: metallophosphoesterase family protein [Thermomicrobiales bacterium]|nr:metallophosphoesterase family protein [Thermomicrobiales bacterium]
MATDQPARVAFVSDVHGNLPALQAVLADIDERGEFDALVGGGDFAFGGAFPQRCVDLTRARGMQCVRGNTDEWVVESATGGRIMAKGYEPKDAHGAAMLAVDDWVAKALDTSALRFLINLPLDWRATGPSGQRLVFVHATPWSSHPIVRPDADEETLTRMLDEADADVLVYGHIHHAYVRQVGERTVACAGSVGVPLDGDPRPAYLIATDDGDGWQLEHVRLEYDRDAYLSELAGCGMPNAAVFIDRVRNASM